MSQWFLCLPVDGSGTQRCYYIPALLPVLVIPDPRRETDPRRLPWLPPLDPEHGNVVEDVSVLRTAHELASQLHDRDLAERLQDVIRTSALDLGRALGGAAELSISD